jgi:hypothetical protein
VSYDSALAFPSRCLEDMIPSHQPKGDDSAHFLRLGQGSQQAGEDFKGRQTVAGDTGTKQRI